MRRRWIAGSSPAMTSGYVRANERNMRKCLDPRYTTLAHHVASIAFGFGDLDLLRAAGLDAGAVPLLDKAAHPDPAVFELLGRQPRPREDALITFRDRDSERLRPAPAEIHVDRAAALADRQDLALDDRETTPSGQELRPALGPQLDIIRIAPEAKLGRPRHTLS